MQLASAVKNEKLVTVRRERCLTQKKLADCLGISETTISRWERYEQWPQLCQLNDLCKFFNSTPEALGFNYKMQRSMLGSE